MKAVFATFAVILGGLAAWTLLGPGAQGAAAEAGGPGMGAWGAMSSGGPIMTDSARAADDSDAETDAMKTEVAMFGLGCFWKPELVFSKLEGVVDAEVGYAGGHTENPTYKEVCYERTGHAEVVRITFDPEKTSYATMLAKFWEIHDPTQVNRQGPDIGDQYRSVIFALTPEQAEAAKSSKQAQAPKHSRPIATQIVEGEDPNYTKAEDYHQDYLAKRGQESCGI